jgi:hypothetical protein
MYLSLHTVSPSLKTPARNLDQISGVPSPDLRPTLKGRGGLTPLRLCAFEDLDAGKLFGKRRIRETV